MAITNRIDLSGVMCIESGCSKLLFTDSTGFLMSDSLDNQNDLGYGLTGGITLNDVTSAKLNVYYPTITTPIVFTFLIEDGVIVSATLTDLQLVTHDITSLLASTDFPLTNFDITLGYGVTLPEVTDGLFAWDYSIYGKADSVDFAYTTSDAILSTCAADCCVEKSYLEIDANCGCFDNKIKNIITTEVFLSASKYAMNAGQSTKADDLLTKAKEICDSNCKNC